MFYAKNITTIITPLIRSLNTEGCDRTEYKKSALHCMYEVVLNITFQS